ncbi:hypothetical protein COU37_00875 [Candidatus Micrarchaeota archaeon CG10_big_fil_rev_8_21_14_0_10_45_29]|nr:MAG: hypothetical protein COU37_00875 [Candidatus Micrarchaeota archaeon CG10_big_fil_rev_8_21_14_0_10_45_29]
MKCVFEAEISKKAEVISLLEADPYGKEEQGEFAGRSFSRNGYKFKEGLMLGEDKEKVFVYLKGPDDFLPFATKKFEGIAKRCSPEDEARILKKIDDEEQGAEMGVGAIFG